MKRSVMLACGTQAWLAIAAFIRADRVAACRESGQVGDGPRRGPPAEVGGETTDATDADTGRRTPTRAPSSPARTATAATRSLRRRSSSRTRASSLEPSRDSAETDRFCQRASAVALFGAARCDGAFAHAGAGLHPPARHRAGRDAAARLHGAPPGSVLADRFLPAHYKRSSARWPLVPAPMTSACRSGRGTADERADASDRPREPSSTRPEVDRSKTHKHNEMENT